MKKTGLLFIISFLITAFGIGCSNQEQSKPAKIEIFQNFEVGKKYEYELRKGKADSRKPGSEKIKSSTSVELTILSRKDSFKLCSWKYGRTEIIGIDVSEFDEQTRKMLNISEGIEIKFLINDKGVIQEIANYEECKAFIENSFEVLYSNMPKRPSAEEIKAIMKTLEPTYETPEMLISTYCPELTGFFSMFDETILTDSVYVRQSYLPNPFGGPDFPSEVVTKIESVKDNIASVSVEQSIPAKELTQIMNKTLIDISKNSKNPVSDDETIKMDLKINAIFTYNYKEHELTKLYSEKLIDVNGVKQNQTLLVILKK